MIEEQEAVRGRLFTIQDVMQSTVRAWLQVNALANSSSKVLIGISESNRLTLILVCAYMPLNN